MKLNVIFILNAILLGVGLAMDAFSVSLANGLNEPKMKKSKEMCIALVFGVFQTLMPLIGWLLLHILVEKFVAFQKYVPWIALILLLYIGGKMLLEGIKKEEGSETAALDFVSLMVQGVATSIDALSVGFTIAEYSLFYALVETIIIGLVTSVICLLGLELGKKFGTKLANKASIIGGVILIAIGIEIFVKGVFF